MTARLKLSRVLLIFGPDGDNNIQDPETGCFVTFLHNGRVQISTNTTNDAATTRQRQTHERLLGSCLVHTKTRSQDHLPLITTCPAHPRASAELNQSGTNWTLSFVTFCSLQRRLNTSLSFRSSIFLSNNQYHRLMVVFMDPCNNQMAMANFANSCNYPSFHVTCLFRGI